MRDALLPLNKFNRLRKKGALRSLLYRTHALEPVGDGDQDVMDSARLQVVEDLHPELGSLGVFDPDAQDVAAAIG